MDSNSKSKYFDKISTLFYDIQFQYYSQFQQNSIQLIMNYFTIFYHPFYFQHFYSLISQAVTFQHTYCGKPAQNSSLQCSKSVELHGKCENLQAYSNYRQKSKLNNKMKIAGNTQGDKSSTCQVQSEMSMLAKKKIYKFKNKNTQSNLSNQIFSFLSCREKSQKLLIKVLLHLNLYSQSTVDSYFNKSIIFYQKKRKYKNKKLIFTLTTQLHDDHENSMDNETFVKISRIMVLHYLNNNCHNAILTSKKILKETRGDHLQRRRQMVEYLKSEYNRKGKLKLI